MTAITVNKSKDPRTGGYPHRLNWYEAPPPYELTLQQFELWALDRLAVLKSIETAQVRNIKKDDELRTFTRDVIKKYLPLAHNSARDNTTDDMRTALFNERKKDHTSHFLLRLAYCRTEDLRHWFLKMETELFRLRLLDEGVDSTDKFLRQAEGMDTVHVDLSIIPNTSSERQFHSNLVRDLALLSGQQEREVLTQTFFKVEFQKVPDLVQKRMVVIKRGYAYVPFSMRTIIIVNEFKDRLKNALEMTAKALPRMDEDDRLDPILTSISKQYINTRNSTYGNGDASSVISHADIDSFAQKHFPLCMKTLHNTIRTDAHLKHSARLQYGLFLKGIGMPLEEALVFWRKAFNRMTDDQFQKGGYAYNIRHNYGMEGKRANYAPYSCVKIITSNQPSATEHHGCPFRHYSQDNLKTLLSQTISKGEGVSHSTVSNSVDELLKMVTDGHYQIACTRLFEITHKIKNAETIDHPNMWFEMSHDGVSSLSNNVKKESVVLKSSGKTEDVSMHEFDENENTIMSMMLMDSKIDDSTSLKDGDDAIMDDAAEMKWFCSSGKVLPPTHSAPSLDFKKL